MVVKQKKKYKHHYVPRFYLEGFTDPNNLGFLWVYEKGTEKPFRSKPKSIAFEKHYYTQTTDQGEKDSETLENLFSLVESEAAPVFQKIKSLEMPDINEKLTLASFIALLFLRTPRWRKIIEKIVLSEAESRLRKMTFDDKEFRASTKRAVEAVGDPLDFNYEEYKKFVQSEDWTISTDNETSLRALKSATWLARVIFSMEWTFLKATERFKFITSDSPVYNYDPTFEYKHGGMPGFTDKNIEVTLPISSNLFLLCIWGSEKEETIEGVFPAKNEIVKSYNRRIVISAHRHIYASENSEGIQTIVKKYGKY